MSPLVCYCRKYNISNGASRGVVVHMKEIGNKEYNRYMRFADKEVEKRRSEWQTNEKWAYFIGSDRGRLKLTTKPEPYTLTRTLNWISRQVAPTWKVLQKIDSTNGTTYLKDILDHSRL